MQKFTGFKNISSIWTVEDDNKLNDLYNIDKLTVQKISEILNKPECYIISKLIKLNIIKYRDDCRGYQKYRSIDTYNENIDSERLFYIRENKYISKNKLIDEDTIIEEEKLSDRMKRLINLIKEIKYIIKNKDDYNYDENYKDSKYINSTDIYMGGLGKIDKLIRKAKIIKKFA